MKNYFKSNIKTPFAIFFAVICLMLGVSAVTVDSANGLSTAEVELQQNLMLYVNEVEDKNTALSETNITGIPTTITFSEYLSFNELERYVERHNVEIVQLQIRGLMEDGTRVTAFTRTDAGLPETESILLDSSDRTGFNVVGITGMYALVNSEDLVGITNDPKTYLADTSGYIEQAQAQKTGGDSLDVVEGTFPHSLVWSLEDAGLLG